MKIALLGDVALFGKYSLAENPTVESYFADVSSYLARFDYVVANLETPFVARGRAAGPKSAYVRSHPRNVDLLRYINVNVVNLANNHLFDYGIEGYRSTLASLDSHGIAHFGTERRSLRLDGGASGVVRLHGYCSHDTNPLGAGSALRRGIVDVMNVRDMENAVRTAARQRETAVLSVHSGFEHVNYPSPIDIRVARHLAKIAPYVYYGHHPHVIQGYEEFEGSKIAYSLGNFCFDDVYTSASGSVPLVAQSENNRRGLILELEISGPGRVSSRLTPVVQSEEKLVVGSRAVEDLLTGYSAALALPGKSYEELRSELVDQYVQSRVALRDVKWFVRRLRPRYASLLLHSRWNRWLHRRNVVDLLP